MKKTYLLSLYIVFSITTTLCRAQNMPELHLKPPPAHIVIDGDIKDWGDSLNYYSPEERLSYGIANSNDTIYLAVKIYDKSEIARIMNAGLTFSIDPRGKKKETFSLTYPLNLQGSTPAFTRPPDNEDGVTQDDRDALMRRKLTSLRGIKVVGFKDIEDDMITTSNTYGIRTDINYDEAGNLIYEEAIPLSFFHVDLSPKNQWAFNIKINGIKRPEGGGGDHPGGGEGGGGGMHGGGMGGGGGHHGGGGGGHRGGGGTAGTDQGEIAKTVDFWGKFNLAK